MPATRESCSSLWNVPQIYRWPGIFSPVWSGAFNGSCVLPRSFFVRSATTTMPRAWTSARGLFLENDYPAQLDEVFDLAFNLPGQPSQIIEVQAKVVWVNTETRFLRPGYPIGAGVEFVNLPESSAALIREYVAGHSPVQEQIRNGRNRTEPPRIHLVS